MQKDNIISSVSNPKITELIKIRDYKKYRDEKQLFFLEGERLINDTKKELLVSLFINENYNKDLTRYDDITKYIVTDNVFNKIKDTINSQGIIALAKKQLNIDYEKCFENNVDNIVLLDDVQDPGNLGTIFRTCEASGIKDILMTSDCCDCYMPKVLRASMSSIFRLNLYIIDDILNMINRAKKHKYSLISTAPKSNNKYYNYDFTKQKNIIVFGNEANGIRKEILSLCDDSINIPMDGSIESLNVSISCALILYEIKKQKDIKNEK